jgi:hypothetical protein
MTERSIQKMGKYNIPFVLDEVVFVVLSFITGAL